MKLVGFKIKKLNGLSYEAVNDKQYIETVIIATLNSWIKKGTSVNL